MMNIESVTLCSMLADKMIIINHDRQRKRRNRRLSLVDYRRINRDKILQPRRFGDGWMPEDSYDDESGNSSMDEEFTIHGILEMTHSHSESDNEDDMDQNETNFPHFIQFFSPALGQQVRSAILVENHSMGIKIRLLNRINETIQDAEMDVDLIARAVLDSHIISTLFDVIRHSADILVEKAVECLLSLAYLSEEFVTEILNGNVYQVIVERIIDRKPSRTIASIANVKQIKRNRQNLKAYATGSAEYQFDFPSVSHDSNKVVVALSRLFHIIYRYHPNQVEQILPIIDKFLSFSDSFVQNNALFVFSIIISEDVSIMRKLPNFIPKLMQLLSSKEQNLVRMVISIFTDLLKCNCFVKRNAKLLVNTLSDLSNRLINCHYDFLKMYLGLIECILANTITITCLRSNHFHSSPFICKDVLRALLHIMKDNPEPSIEMNALRVLRLLTRSTFHESEEFKTQQVVQTLTDILSEKDKYVQSIEIAIDVLDDIMCSLANDACISNTLHNVEQVMRDLSKSHNPIVYQKACHFIETHIDTSVAHDEDVTLLPRVFDGVFMFNPIIPTIPFVFK